jgi:hypothetical protein
MLTLGYSDTSTTEIYETEVNQYFKQHESYYLQQQGIEPGAL